MEMESAALKYQVEKKGLIDERSSPRFWKEICSSRRMRGIEKMLKLGNCRFDNGGRICERNDFRWKWRN